ncbi:hypothetical protein PG991_008929 [Apiospora marii]|uniref:Uncharacterized protein n=1 Tax=Apiospora marii TaxID=335849 RepID=A0ABR1RJA8_9PEZI
MLAVLQNWKQASGSLRAPAVESFWASWCPLRTSSCGISGDGEVARRRFEGTTELLSNAAELLRANADSLVANVSSRAVSISYLVGIEAALLPRGSEATLTSRRGQGSFRHGRVWLAVSSSVSKTFPWRDTVWNGTGSPDACGPTTIWVLTVRLVAARFSSTVCGQGRLGGVFPSVGAGAASDTAAVCIRMICGASSCVTQRARIARLRGLGGLGGLPVRTAACRAQKLDAMSRIAGLVHGCVSRDNESKRIKGVTSWEFFRTHCPEGKRGIIRVLCLNEGVLRFPCFRII